MEFFAQAGAGLLFALACNVDTVLAVVGYSARGRQCSRWDAWKIAAVTTAITYASLELGSAGAALLPGVMTRRLGALALAGLGVWYVAQALWGGGETAQPDRGWLALSAALAVNNAGVGVAAGVSGLRPLTAAGCNFAVTLLALALGGLLGRGLGRWSRWALPVSGALLVIMGLWALG